MAHLAYFRVSTSDQSIEAQRSAMGASFERTFQDEGISGAVMAKDRPGFSALLAYAREGDTIHVYAVDRLGRDALDVQATVRGLIDRGVSVDVRGLGVIGRGVGELILAVLAQVADMERGRIAERCESGREAARASLKATGRTHKGKISMGRPKAQDAAAVADWRKTNNASISQTAQHFGLSDSTVKRYTADALAHG